MDKVELRGGSGGNTASLPDAPVLQGVLVPDVLGF